MLIDGCQYDGCVYFKMAYRLYLNMIRDISNQECLSYPMKGRWTNGELSSPVWAESLMFPTVGKMYVLGGLDHRHPVVMDLGREPV